ncbi:PHP domain-containing protein [Paenibacillus motobuensis]|uniref:PHP domain-containing protein n=1 Tax=Paenibacillus TaxID=44249 RepID=UPI00203C84AA|nr:MULTISPECIES: PHP domain-containing protein [Paenibacillus]MCM3039002.1 PHP domain-containing protein [Paenibacillus lutimineralis]MCM3646106.1 PHP domain-containing protein [Paenibacillus motobuensis]
MIDLHQHTNCSDGLLSVQETIEIFVGNSGKTIAITDHDTFKSQLEAKSLCDKFGIEYVFGVELSTIYKNQSVHVLGYFPNYPSDSIVKYIEHQTIISAVKRIRSNASDWPIGHYPIEEIIRLIHSSNGIAILAHPVMYKLLLNDLISIVDGLECINPAQDVKFTEELIQICRDKNLYCTFGTDFHGNLGGDNINYNALYTKYHYIIEPFISEIKIRAI